VERQIPAVTFSEGTTKQELCEFLGLLRVAPERVESRGGAALWLRSAGVQHILLEAPRKSPAYEGRWEAFVAIQDATDRSPLQKLLSLCPESSRTASSRGESPSDDGDMLPWLVAALDATAAASSDDSPDNESWLRQVLSSIRALTPSLQGRLFRVDPFHTGDVLCQVASLLPADEAAKLLVTRSDAVVNEPSEQLEVVLHRLMPTGERAAEVEPAVKSLLLSHGMTEESYRSVVSLLVKKSLSPPPRSLRLKATTGQVRTPSLLTDIMSSVASRALQESRLDMLLELVSSPGDLKERNRLARELAESVPESLAELSDEGAADFLRRLEEAIALDVFAPQEKRLLRAEATRAFSPEFCRRMARYVLREPHRDSLAVLRLMSGAEGEFDALRHIARETSLPSLQSVAGSAILRMGESSLRPCHQILSSGSSQEAVALAHCLVLSGSREGLRRALWALDHPDRAVVAGLMEALAHSRDEQAELALLEALRDGFPEVQAAAASSLGQHPSDRSIAALSAVVSGPFVLRRTSVVRPAVAALGRIGRVECLPPLRALLKRRSLLRRADVRELWTAASEALASIPDPAADEILSEGATRGPAERRELCRRALEVRQRTTHDEAEDVAT
jgi:hypothetical protein